MGSLHCQNHSSRFRAKQCAGSLRMSNWTILLMHLWNDCGRKLRIPMRHDRPAINISTGKEEKTDEAYWYSCRKALPKSLAAYAANQVATTILFNRLVAFWAWFGVDCEPVYSLRLIFALFVPESPHITGTRRMRFCHAIEAKLLPTNALDFTVGFAFHSNGIATVRNAGAPLDFCIVFNVWLKEKPLVSFNWLWVLSPHQFSHFVLITNSTALVLHTCHTPTLTLFDFNDEVLSPAWERKPLLPYYPCVSYMSHTYITYNYSIQYLS
jgi:hypothetical protein